MNYIILSLKHSTKETPTFWRPNDAGYTDYLTHAGVYSEEEIKRDPGYYNNGYSTLAIPATEAGFESIGLKITYDLKKALALADKVEKQRKKEDK